MPELLKSKALHLSVATHATGYGTGWWLSEWQWQPGNDTTDAIVFQAFALNFAVFMWMYMRATTRKAVDDA